MSKKILIIEDDTFLGDVLLRKLTHVGYEAQLKRDGQEGFEAIKSWMPDLILLDIVMPKMNGYEVLEAVQKDPTLTHIPIVIISNSGQTVEINRALSLGAKDYLIKAVIDPEEVLSKVRLYLANPEAGGKNGTALLKGKSVLWVEDDSFLSDILARRFGKEECESLHAVNGEEALALLEEKNPDIILLDLILPNMSGFEVLEKIKQTEKGKRTPVVVFSNLAQESDIERSKKLGALKHFLKAELNPDDLIQQLAEILQ